VAIVTVLGAMGCDSIEDIFGNYGFD